MAQLFPLSKHVPSLISRSHLYTQLENALQKHFFCIFCFDRGYFKRFHWPIFITFSVQSQSFTGVLTGTDLP